MKPQLEHICDIRVHLIETLDIGATPDGHRRFTTIADGAFDGPRMRGDILPGGADSCARTMAC